MNESTMNQAAMNQAALNQAARLLALATLAICPFLASAADQPPKLRLGEVENIDPTSYKVDLSLDPLKNTFSGSIVINLDIKKPVQTIWLNQEKITVQSAALTASGKTLSAKAIP